jgi:predicted phosphohydrolase
MRIFGIADMHLESGTGKTMDRFGENWRNHDRKMFGAWESIGREDDVLVIAGDTSWAMRLDQAEPDLRRIGDMRGRKVLIRGNHDYWWESLAKLRRVLHPSIHALQASSVIIDRVAFAGTRGWICPNDVSFREEDRKIYDREVGRLRLALESLTELHSGYDHLVVVLHYPPVNQLHQPSGFSDLIDRFQASACIYGHLHGEAIKTGLTGLRSRTRYYLVSADSVDFAPAEIAIQ